MKEKKIRLSSLEELDPVANTVVAFIDANRCKKSPAAIVKRVLSPESKFLFVGNVNQEANADLFNQALYRMQVKDEQKGLYEPFDNGDLFVASAGLGTDRIGIPTITKACDLPALTTEQSALLPTGEYGTLYLYNSHCGSEPELIAQYFKLTGLNQYVLVGDFSNSKMQINYAYAKDTSLITSTNQLPTIHYHQSLPNNLMRKVVAGATTSLVVTTGVTSTLEALQDGKLSYYQDLSPNVNFVEAYLIAVKSIASTDTSLVGCMPQMIIELTSLLFAPKPLSKNDMKRTNELLQMSSVPLRTIETNRTIIDKASGKLAPRLLSFINGAKHTQNPVQLAYVCASLRKPGEKGSPVHDQALRRAAAWNRLFEIKVLIASMDSKALDKKDPNLGRSALYFAVEKKNLDCARALVNAGANVNTQDKEGRTPLHVAVSQGNREMIKMLIAAGASLEIVDKQNNCPTDTSKDSGLIMFVLSCCDSRGQVLKAG